MFQDKFKERKPEDTIKLIKEFFINKNFLLIENFIQQNLAGTFSCQFSLYFKNIHILTTNGKGLTKLFAEASGLSEMYERFCNFYFLQSNNNIFLNEYIKYTKIVKKISKQEALSNFDYLIDYLNENLNKENYYGFKYINFNNKEQSIFIDPTAIFRMTTTNGMAAGNTLEEAFNQGISELFERYVLFQFYQNKIDKYYILKKENIQNQELKNIIQNIENTNKKIIIIDFSYNFNLPVLGCICIDLETNGIRSSFGSFLFFDIALERCLTELWQTNSNDIKIQECFIPSPDIFYQLRIMDKGNMGMIGCLPKTFLNNNNFIYQENFNNNIFINNQNIDNFELLELNKNIAIKNNFDLYYRDVSLDNNLKAIHILSNKSQINYGIADYFKICSQETKNFYIYLLSTNILLINDIVYNNITPKDFIKKYYKFFEQYIKKLDNNSKILIAFQDQSNFFASEKIYAIISNLIINEYVDITAIQETRKSIFYKKFKLLYTIIKFKEQNLYSNEELFNILNNLNLQVSKEFIQNCTNLEYVIEECYFKPIKENYLILQDFMQTLVFSGLT